MTLTLPISALFACAIVYGRLAADSEFDACKASGINIHRLLAPAFGLSVFTAAFTYTFTNHLIPKFIEQLDELVRQDIQKIVFSALTNRGHLNYLNYVLYAGDTRLENEDTQTKTVLIQQAAFLQFEHDKLAYCGTADVAQVDFTPDPQGGPPMVKAVLRGIRSLDMVRDRFMEFDEQPFESMQLPQKIRIETKFMTLPQLMDYHRHPLELPTIEDNLAKLNWLVREAQFYKWACEQLTGPKRVLKLADARESYEIRADRVLPEPENLRPKMQAVTVKEKDAEGRRRTYTANGCQMALARGELGSTGSAVLLSLNGNVSLVDAAVPSASVTARNRWELDKVALPSNLPGMAPPPDLQTLLGDLTDPAALQTRLPSLNLGTRVDDERESSRKSIVKSSLQITGLIHSRLAFSASTLVILVLAAALGVIYRGGQLLTAFVISFLPGMVVVVMNITGRQLTENSGTHLVGLAVIWGAIALLALADVVVLARYLKR
jgi:lipopolysaccharide export LptBFGC system permease protein LptF